MGKKRTKDGKLKENPVYQDPEDAAAAEQPVAAEASPENDAAAAGSQAEEKAGKALKPLARAKGKKLQRRGAEGDKPAAPAEKAEEAEPVKEEEEQADESLTRSVWFEVAEAEGGLDVEEVRKVMRTVGEVQEVTALLPHRVQCTFAQPSSVRQVLLLHNKQAGQLPRLAASAADAKKRKCVTQNPEARVTIDYPLPAHLRIHVSQIPSNCDNRELQQTLSHYGKVAYIFRNPHKHYGFAAFTKKSSVDRAVSDEAVMMRGTLISIKRYQATGGDMRHWQKVQLDGAIQYLNSLIPYNPYVAASPSTMPAKAPSAPAVQEVSNAQRKKNKKRKAAEVEEEKIGVVPQTQPEPEQDAAQPASNAAPEAKKGKKKKGQKQQGEAVAEEAPKKAAAAQSEAASPKQAAKKRRKSK
eukprot:TRINITY_DN4975_c0_g3_i1.p1 TRINITY_DN4975_c0_g3~~TRINITY_DN4975_c0_g3_i1.p1  ORF type:complete len:412 (+),score=204.69 TRINITY_DN4975_c0_g3_i1:99-1334(+)